MPTDQELYARRLTQLIDSAGKLEDKQVRQILKFLNGIRQQVIETIGTAKGFEAQHLMNLLSEINRHIQRLNSSLISVTQATQGDLWDNGQEVGKLSAEIFAPTVGIVGLTTEQLAIAQGFSADLITGLTSDAMRKISTQVQLASLGTQSVTKTIDAIGRNLTEPSVFGTVATRAEAIFRTEVNRVHSMATQATLNQIVKAVPKMQKMWVYKHFAQFPRIGHMAMDGKVVDVDKPFMVSPDNKRLPEPMMYPRDPAASAANSVFCKCHVVPFNAEWANKSVTTGAIAKTVRAKKGVAVVTPTEIPKVRISTENAIISQAQKLAKEFESEKGTISIGNLPKKKWAETHSKTGDIIFDKDILELPPELANYIITHELIHRHIPNHGLLFKLLMKARIPNIKEIEKQLASIASKEL